MRQKKHIDHIAIRVSDLDLAQTWYEKHLGAELQFKDRFYRRMLLNNTTLMKLITKKELQKILLAKEKIINIDGIFLKAFKS